MSGKLSLAILVGLVSGCSTVKGPVFTLECLVEGPSVGEARITYPIDTASSKMYWKTGSSVWHPVEAAIMGEEIKATTQLTLPSGDVLRSDALTFNLADLTISMATEKFDGKEKSSASGTCMKRAASSEELELLKR
jgi:hypothetical protein